MVIAVGIGLAALAAWRGWKAPHAAPAPAAAPAPVAPPGRALPARADASADVPIAPAPPPERVPARPIPVAKPPPSAPDIGDVLEGVAVKKGLAVASAAGAAALGGGGIAAAGDAIAAAGAAALPVAIVGTIAGSIGIAAIDIFGGGVDIQTYATTPQLDASTALGQAAARKQAPLIKASLAETGTKWGFKGAPTRDVLLG